MAGAPQKLPAGVVSSTTPQLYPVLFGPDGKPVKVVLPEGTYPMPPGPPEEAVLPQPTPPRAIVPAFGQNRMRSGRRFAGKQLTPYETLRNLAEFDLVRLAIEDVKGQLVGMEWGVGVRKEFKDQAEQLQGEVDQARAWVESPDPLLGIGFEDWLSRVVEEVLVTDALTLYPRQTLGGDPIGLEQIDGATIQPLVDERGRPPLPPVAAYNQVAHGRVETEFTFPFGPPSSTELWYLPMAQRVENPYGRSCVERVLWTINLAIRRYTDDLSYYSSGNLPDAIYQMPGGLTHDQVSQFQETFDAILEGREDRRSGRVHFVPGGEGSQFVPTKTRDWAPEFNEWLARVVCYAFNTSPLPLVKLMNRATAETSESSGKQGGVWPVAGFIARVVNRYLRRNLGLQRVEFAWSDDEVEDPEVVYQRDVAYLGVGGTTLNEVRKTNGQEPYPPEIGDRPFVQTASGPVFLDTIEEDRLREQEMAQALLEAGPASGPGGDDSEAKEPPAQKAAFVPSLEVHRAALAGELRNWRRKAERLAKTGQAQERFKSKLIRGALRERVEKGLGL